MGAHSMSRSREARTRGPDLDAPLNRASTKRKRARGAGYTCNRGRPSDYTDELLRSVKLMLQGGATIPEIAHALDVSHETVHMWMIHHPEFADAIRRGRDQVDDRVEASLYQRAVGYSYWAEKVFANGTRMRVLEHVPPDPGAAAKWLANRRRSAWSDKLDVSLQADVKATGDLNFRELAMQVLALMQQAGKTPDDAGE